MRRANIAGFAAMACAAAPAAAADMLQLQRTVQPDEAAQTILLVDRERVAVARIRQEPKPSYLVEITVIGEPNIVLAINCQDLAGARQVLDALRPRGAAMLDVSGPLLVLRSR